VRYRLPVVCFVLAIAGLGVVAGPADPASAHPLGNFTVNLYSGIEVMPERFEVQYVLDMAEVPGARNGNHRLGQRAGHSGGADR
jgi:nickel/cobalt exporter